jgi:hypothetical protein
VLEYYNKINKLCIEASYWVMYSSTQRRAPMQPMEKETRLPQNPKEPKPQPKRPSRERVFENLEKWANSPGLQPPK